MGDFDSTGSGGEVPVYESPPSLTVLDGGEYRLADQDADSVLLKGKFKQTEEHDAREEIRYYNRFKIDQGAKFTYWEGSPVTPAQTREVKVGDKCQKQQLVATAEYKAEWKLVLRWQQIVVVDENLEWWYGLFDGSSWPEVKGGAFVATLAGGKFTATAVAATPEACALVALKGGGAMGAAVGTQLALVGATAFILTTGIMSKYKSSTTVVSEGWVVVGKFRAAERPTGTTKQVWGNVGEPYECKKKRPVTGSEPPKETKVGMGLGPKIGIGVGAGVLALGGAIMTSGGADPDVVPSSAPSAAAPTASESATAPSAPASSEPIGQGPTRGEQELAAYRGEAFPFTDPVGDWITSRSQDPATLMLDHVDIIGSGVRMLSYAPSAAPASLATVVGTGGAFDCGHLEAFSVVCAGGNQMAGDQWLFSMSLADAVPKIEPDGWSYTYSLVVDTDGDPSNNWVANASFDWDIFQGSDRWYELLGTPEADGSIAWELVVTDARLGAERGNTTSTARAIIDGDRVSFLVPADELDVASPDWRLTSFSHAGDFNFDTLGADVSVGAPDPWSLRSADGAETVTIDPLEA